MCKHIIVRPTPQLHETSQQIDNVEFYWENGKIIATPKPAYDSVQEDILRSLRENEGHQVETAEEVDIFIPPLMKS